MVTAARILLIDDSKINLQMVGTYLEKQQFQVTQSETAAEALDLLETTTFDLILLDVVMPDRNGIDLCREIKQQPRHQQTPIIFLTAKTDAPSVLKGFEAGAVDYVVKPFQAAELLARVRTHLELKFAREALETANNVKNKLFSVISHDLLSPLSALRGYLDLLAADVLDTETQQQHTEELRVHLGATFNLLQNLLFWAKSQMEGLKRQPGPVRVTDLVEEQRTLLDTHLRKKDITLENHLPDELTVWADREMLRLVLRNLLANAVKFTPAAGRVDVRAETAEDSRPIIAVADTGVGMSAETLARLWDTLDHPTNYGTAGEKGQGLGLKLCRDFITLNEGRLEVDSTPGEGTVFRVVLPNARASTGLLEV